MLIGVIGIISTFFFPIFCVPLNMIGLAAGIIGKSSSKSALAIKGIVVNTIGILINVIFGVLAVLGVLVSGT